VLGYLRKVEHDATKKDLEQIRHAPSLKEAQKALGRFSERWGAMPQGSVFGDRGRGGAFEILQDRGTLLLAQDPNHKRHLMEISGGQKKDPSHGGVLRPDLHGTDPIRCVHIRKPKAGNP